MTLAVIDYLAGVVGQMPCNALAVRALEELDAEREHAERVRRAGAAGPPLP